MERHDSDEAAHDAHRDGQQHEIPKTFVAGGLGTNHGVNLSTQQIESEEIRSEGGEYDVVHAAIDRSPINMAEPRIYKHSERENIPGIHGMLPATNRSQHAI